MSPQSELIMLVGMYAFIGLYFISLYKKTSLERQLIFLSAAIIGYFLAKNVISIYVSPDIQLGLSIAYLSLSFVSLLPYFNNNVFRRQFKTKRRLNFDPQTNTKQISHETKEISEDFLLEDARRLLIETVWQCEGLVRHLFLSRKLYYMIFFYVIENSYLVSIKRILKLYKIKFPIKVGKKNVRWCH